MKSIIFFILALSVTAICFAQSNQTESLTITTYYPAPYGVYRNLKLNPSDLPTTGVDRGVMYYDDDANMLRYHNDTGWVNLTGSGGNGYWAENTTTHNIYNTNLGKVGVGTTAPVYTLEINGSFAATYKNFDIPDPRYHDARSRLIHSSLEGPEHAVYYRGTSILKDGQVSVTLPGYFESLTRKENRTVMLTCFNGYSPLYVAGELENGAFTVKTTQDGNPQQEFFWEVKAVRSDIPELKVENNEAE